MNESEMIGLIVVCLGTILGVGAIVVTPMLQVVKSMTELHDSIKTLASKLSQIEINNLEAHKRIWNHNDEQDEKLQDHELRIKLMEEKNNG